MSTPIQQICTAQAVQLHQQDLEIKKTKSLITELKRTIKGYIDGHAASDDLIKKLRTDLKNLQQTVDRLRTERNEAETSLKRVDVRATKDRESINAFKTRVEGLEMSVRNKTLVHETLQLMYDQRGQQLEVIQMELDALREIVDRNKAIVDKLKKSHASELSKVRAECQTLIDKGSAEANAIISELRERPSSPSGSYGEVLMALQRATTAMETHPHDPILKFMQSIQQTPTIQNLDQMWNSLEPQVQSVYGNMYKLMARCVTMPENEVLTIRETLDKTRDALEKVRADAVTQIREVGLRAQQKYKELEDEREHSDRVIDALREDLTEAHSKNQEINMLKQKLVEAEQEREQAEQDRDDAYDAYYHSDRENDELKDSICVLKASVNEMGQRCMELSRKRKLVSGDPESGHHQIRRSARLAKRHQR